MISPYSRSIVRDYLKFSRHNLSYSFLLLHKLPHLSSYSLFFKTELQHYPVELFCFHVLQLSLLFHLLGFCYFVITIVASNWFFYPRAYYLQYIVASHLSKMVIWSLLLKIFIGLFTAFRLKYKCEEDGDSLYIVHFFSPSCLHSDWWHWGDDPVEWMNIKLTPEQCMG